MKQTGRVAGPIAIRISLALALCLLPLCLYASGYQAAPFDIPRLENIRIDGKTNDWKGGGMFVPFMGTDDSTLPDPASLQATMRVGWSPSSLYILLEVQDNVGWESSSTNEFWRKDCIEYFIGSAFGSKEYYQVVVSPGNDKRQKQLRYEVYDFREEHDAPVSLMASSSIADGKYVVEVEFPFANIVQGPQTSNALFTLQVCVCDVDEGRGYPKGWSRIMWFPDGNTSKNPRSMYSIRLSDKPSPPRSTADAWAQAAIAGLIERDKAMPLLSNLLLLWPNDERTHHMLGWFQLHGLGDSSAARRHLDKAVDLSRKHSNVFVEADSLFRLAFASEQTEQRLRYLNEAVEAVEDVQSFEAEYLKVRAAMSVAFFLLQDDPQSQDGMARAAAAYEMAKASGYEEFYAQCESMFARHHLSSGRHAEARTHLERMRDLSRSNKDRAYASEMLKDLQKIALTNSTEQDSADE